MEDQEIVAELETLRAQLKQFEQARRQQNCQHRSLPEQQVRKLQSQRRKAREDLSRTG